MTSRIPHPYQFDYDQCKENQKYFFFWMSSLSVEEKITLTCHIIFCFYALNFEKVGSILVSACPCVRPSIHLFKKKFKLGF